MTAAVAMGKDPEQTLQAIRACGDDFESLAKTIKEAEWLAETPGEYRQQWRASKTKLRSIYQDLVKQAEEDKKNGIVRRAYRTEEEFPRIKDGWQGLKWKIRAMPGGATKKVDDFYTLYGYFQQATAGDNTAPQPVWAASGGLDFEGRSKWDAWNKLKGLSSEVAKKKFVALYYELDPKACLYKDGREEALP